MTTTIFGPIPGHVSGCWENKEVWIDGQFLCPSESLTVVKHSPDGFNWSYSGSGPAQLAFAILQYLVDDEFAKCHYQKFKAEFIADLPPTNFVIDIASIRQWILAIQSISQKEEVHNV